MDLLKSIAHPEEVCALLKYKFGLLPADRKHANTVRLVLLIIITRSSANAKRTARPLQKY